MKKWSFYDFSRKMTILTLYKKAIFIQCRNVKLHFDGSKMDYFLC